MSLPVEVVLVILGALKAKDLLLMSQTCQSMFVLCQHNAVWKRVCKQAWNLRVSSCINRPQRWKQYYSQRQTLGRNGAVRWNVIKPSGDNMSKRYQHTGSVVGKNIYFIGGQELAEKRFDDIYALNTETLDIKKVMPTGDVPRFARHSAVTIGDKIVMFGGFDGVSQHYLLSCYDTTNNTWSSPTSSGSVPPSRTNHAAVAVGNKMYLFGGMYKESRNGSDHLVFLNDMHCLDYSTAELKWQKVNQLGEVPSPRCGHRLLAFGHRLILFGGGFGEQWDRKYSDVHVFDTNTNIWTKPKVSGSAPVCTFTVAFAVGNFMFIFGGQSLADNNLTNSLYCLDTVSLEWTLMDTGINVPSQRDMASGNVVGNNMIMFGGYHGMAVDSWWSLEIDPVLAGPQSALLPHA